MKEYDIIIVGAGPGGSMTAKVAAEKGLKTIFFERGRKPGEKNSSGTGLGPRMFRDFPEIMKQLTPDNCPSMREGKYQRSYFVDKDDKVGAILVTTPTNSMTYSPGKNTYDPSKYDKFITMNCYRSEFDPWLAKFATDAGAELKTHTLIKGLFKEEGKFAGVIDGKGEKYKAPMIIGADGAISTVAKSAGLRDKWHSEHITVVPQYDFHVPKENIDKVMGEETLAVYWGVNFPAAYQAFFNDGFHLGLGNWMTYWKHNPMYYVNRVINIPHMKSLIKRLEAKPREVQAHLLPWLPYPKNTHCDNVILIGDAGGFPCPLEAEGMYPAMVTGKVAAEVAAEAISAEDYSKAFLSQYDERWEQTSVGKEFEDGDVLWNVWKALPFHATNMQWFVPLMTEVISAFFCWSEPHTVRIRQMLSAIKSMLPEAMPTLLEDVLPVLFRVLGDKLDTMLDPGQMMTAIPKLLNMLPDKKKKRRGS